MLFCILLSFCVMFFLVFCKLVLYFGTLLSVASKFSHIHSSVSWLHYFVQISFHRLCQFYFPPSLTGLWGCCQTQWSSWYHIVSCFVSQHFQHSLLPWDKSKATYDLFEGDFLSTTPINILLAKLHCLHLGKSSINDVVFDLASLQRYDGQNNNHMTERISATIQFHTANRKHPYTSRTLANGQSVR